MNPTLKLLSLLLIVVQPAISMLCANNNNPINNSTVDEQISQTSQANQNALIKLWETTYNSSGYIKKAALDKSGKIYIYLGYEIDSEYEKFIVFDSLGYSETIQGIVTDTYGKNRITDVQYGAYRKRVDSYDYRIYTYKKVDGSTDLGWITELDHPVSYNQLPNDILVDMAVNLSGEVYLLTNYAVTSLNNYSRTLNRYITVNYRDDGTERWRQISEYNETPKGIMLDHNSNVYVTGTAGSYKWNRLGQEICKCDTTSGTKLQITDDSGFYIGHIKRMKDWYYYVPEGGTEYEWDDHIYYDVQLIRYNSDCEELWRADCEQEDYFNYYDREPSDFTQLLLLKDDFVYVAVRNNEFDESSSYLYKYNNNGELQWVNNLEIIDLTYSNSNYLYAIGKDNLYKINDIDGTVEWQHNIFEFNYFDYDYPGKVFIDSRDNIYVCGISRFDGIKVLKFSQKEDEDGDGIPNDTDNCPFISNPAQADSDHDGVGDTCDNCPLVPNNLQIDSDGDTFGDSCDYCPDRYDTLNIDTDGDGIGDVCDNCVINPNPSQRDDDKDGVGYSCDNCHDNYNPRQLNSDNDDFGNACDPDDDNDGIPDEVDVCPVIPNPSQLDTDGDGVGDVCNNDIDKDNDEWADNIDNCPDTYNPDQKDLNENFIGDTCERDLTINRIEISQVVQNPAGTVPLVKGKDTWIRIFFDVGPANSPIGPVWGRISFTTADRNVPLLTHTGDYSLPVDIMINSDNIIQAVPNPTAENISQSLNFRIPGTWRWDKTPYVHINIFNEDTIPEINTYNNNPPAFPLNFIDVPPLNINYVAIDLYNYELTDFLCSTPGNNDFWEGAEVTLRTYPVGKIQMRKIGLDHSGDPTVSWGLPGFSLIFAINWLDAFTDEPLPYMIYYARVCGEMDPCITSGGALECNITGMGIGGHAWSLVRDNNTLEGAVMPHELCHAIRDDARHTMGETWCPPSNTGYYDDYTGQSNGNLEFGVFGVETDANNDLVIHPWYNHYDLMTYCGPQWMSVYTYMKLFSIMASRTNTTLKSKSGISENSMEYFVISGIISPVDSVEHLKIQQNTMPVKTRDAVPGNYTLTISDYYNNVLYNQSFTPEIIGDPIEYKHFFLTVPYFSEASSIRIYSGDRMIFHRSVSMNKPTVTITNPNGGENISGIYTITWNSADMDDDQLIFDLYYSADDGKSWRPIIMDLNAGLYDWNSELVPGSTNARIRIIASDGVNTTFDDSDNTFTVESKTPEARIIRPADKASYFMNQIIDFKSDAFDEEDGVISSDQFSWSSDIDGDIGIGSGFTAENLSPGTHTITLTVSDSDKNSVSESVEITIQATADIDGDGIGDDADTEPYRDNTPLTFDYGDCVPVYNSYENNLIDNSDFEICKINPWTTYSFDYAGVDITAEIVDGTCRITPVAISSDPAIWHIQLIQVLTFLQISKLIPGNTYVLTFDAKSESDGHTCQVFLGQNEDPFFPLVSEWIEIGDEWNTFSYTFTVSQTYPLMKLAFNLGTEISAVSFDNVKITNLITDSDSDGIEDLSDNCPVTANEDQDDSDYDSVGDACDNCQHTHNTNQTDTDNDHVGNACDNCPGTSNTNQADVNGNGIGDACETVFINEFTTVPEIRLYPNPASQLITVQINQDLEISSIRLFDISGRLLRRINLVNSEEINLSIEGYNDGIYYIEIITDADRFLRKFIIEQEK